MLKWWLLAALLIGISMPAIPQLVINEFLASNSTIISDPDFDDYSDWIEIYNTGSQSVNLLDYYLTDNLSSPTKWKFTTNVSIPAGGFLLVWADGLDAGLHTNFKVSASGEELGLFSPTMNLIDSVTFIPQTVDISYGRSSDGGADWGYFTTPTPGASNSTSSFSDIVYNVPTFSLRGGFYSGQQSVQLSSEFGGTIRYTLDGTEPSQNSQIYSSPIQINSTTNLRARIFRTGMVPGPILTESYFINENSAGGKLPVVSISTDPDNFWDSQTGIYVQNFKPDWEIPVNIELFENNGLDRSSFNQMAGIKVNGLYSWQLPQKMLGVYFKKAYGSGNLSYRVTPQRDRYSYKSFALRASGSDWSYTLFRDMLGQEATMLNTDLDIMGFRPSVVYVNGEYMGIHNMREKVDADYIEKSYNMEPGSFDLVENQEFPEAGNIEAYNHLLSLLNEDLSIAENYDAVADLVDIENFTDLAITEMAVRNTSIDHNVMAWKPKNGGKWRWVVMDLDRGFSDAGSRFIDFYLGQDQLLLEELFQNENYKQYFARRLTAQLFTSFNPTRMRALIDKHEAAIEDEIPFHVSRWQGATSSYGNAIPSVTYWRNEVNNLRVFVEERPAALLADLEDYGFSSIANLVLRSTPDEAANFTIDGLKTASSYAYGPVLKDIEYTLEAKDKPGYDFKGWYESSRTWIIEPGATWKYLVSGSSQGTAWKEPGYSDGSWSSGPAELGYGDGDEATEISYGGSSSNKYITTWFRKSFTITDNQLQNGDFFIHLLKDDGAIVYLNGTEIIRANLPSGTTDYRTTAETSIGGNTEDLFISYAVDKELLVAGNNVIAVEIHQSASNSSDLSFDLRLSYYPAEGGTLLSTSREIKIQLSDDRYLRTSYDRNDYCIVQPVITEDMILDADCSPYMLNEDLLIAENAKLTIDPGVEIRIADGVNIFVYGSLDAKGTASSGVKFTGSSEGDLKKWGGIVFRNTDDRSNLSYVTIEKASEGPDHTIENAAISAFNADLSLNHLSIEDVYSNPIVARYSDITMKNSSLHSEVSGDLINVKYGTASIENCSFRGNDQVDCDAIDYDEIENGIIRKCNISGFYGVNSDAVDIGEKATNILIDSLFVVNVADKGVSVGQRSSALVKNSIFVNCNMGVAVKDSSSASVRNCIFYNNGNAIACYEKNIGLAGGNANVVNSILSNSYDAPYSEDAASSLEVSYSLSDDEILPSGKSNIFGNPLFREPTYFDFELEPGSPGAKTGIGPSGPIDLGTYIEADGFDPTIMISQIFVNGSGLSLPEFITLYNPSDKQVDVSGYEITKGVTAVFPEGTLIGPKRKLFITDNKAAAIWNETYTPVVQWISGKLSDNGESIQLVDNHGLVLDNIRYSDQEDWPFEGFIGENIFVLSDPALDNHFGENWTTASLSEAVVSSKELTSETFRIYPNPSSGIVHIECTDIGHQKIYVMDISGKLLQEVQSEPSGPTTIDLSGYPSGLYFLKAGSIVEKLILSR